MNDSERHPTDGTTVTALTSAVSAVGVPSAKSLTALTKKPDQKAISQHPVPSVPSNVYLLRMRARVLTNNYRARPEKTPTQANNAQKTALRALTYHSGASS